MLGSSPEEAPFARLRELLGSDDAAQARQGLDLLLSLLGEEGARRRGPAFEELLRGPRPRRVALPLLLAFAEQGWRLPGARLDLAYEAIGAEGLRALIAAGCLRGVADLDLRYNALGDEGALALAGCEDLSGLTALCLSRNGLTEIGAQALAESPHLRRLAALDLRYNALGERGARALAGASNLHFLARLDLHRDDVGEDGVWALAGSPSLPADIRRYWRGLAAAGPPEPEP